MLNLFKYILGFILLILGGILFGITMSLVAFSTYLINLFVKGDKRYHYHWPVYHFWISNYLPMIGCPVKVYGLEHFQKGKTYIVTANHKNFLDVTLTSALIPGANKTLAKKELVSIPIFGYLYRQGGILVDRKDPESRKNSLIQMASFLKKGIHICLYPEGTRNKSNKVLIEFKNGAFMLAMETQTNIIPTVIKYTDRYMMPEGKLMVWPHRLEIHFLAEIDVKKINEIEELKNITFQKMYDELIK